VATDRQNVVVGGRAIGRLMFAKEPLFGLFQLHTFGGA